MSTDPFACFDDDLEALRAQPAVRKPVLETIPPEIVKDCFKCRGSGRAYGGTCYACKGTGKHDPARAKRKAAYVKGQQTKAERTAQRMREWIAAHPAEHASLVDGANRGQAFCQNMLNALAEWGSLTDNQLAAVRSGMARLEAKRAEFRAADAARKENAPTVDVSQIEQAFDRARASGKSKVWLHVAGVRFTPAPANGKNPGALYVTQGTDYLGKITGGKFQCTRECDAETSAKVVAIAADPKNAAITEGRTTGTCAVCSRELTDPASVAAGIGPICAERFGW
jgi:hypothetical protein